MRTGLLALAGVAGVAGAIAWLGPVPQAGAQGWTPPRTPWGDPDIQGIFTTDDELGVPFERPEEFGERTVVTEEEFASRVDQSGRQAARDAEAFVEQAPAAAGGTGPPAHWLERGQPSRRTSVVIDPPNGRIPYLDEEARQRSARAVNARTTGPGPFQGPEDLDLYDRCITRGLPHVIFPTIYNNTSADRAGAGLRRHPIRDDPRRPHHPARRAPAPLAGTPPLLRRFARPLGRRHARRGRHQLPDRARSTTVAPAPRCT